MAVMEAASKPLGRARSEEDAGGHAHDYAHVAAGGALREKKRSRTRQLGHNTPPMPASKLGFSLSGLEAVNLQNAPKRWSLERCKNCLAEVMGALKVSCCVPTPISMSVIALVMSVFVEITATIAATLSLLL